jgi:AcrR family transcriptional regulator
MLNAVEQKLSDAEKQAEKRARKQAAGSDRKQQILQQAVEIIAAEGYAKLSMRALARASGITLGALQYHFSTWENMLRALNAYILDQYDQVWDKMVPTDRPPTLQGFMRLVLEDAPGSALKSGNLLPQLYAMSQVEPIMEELQTEIFNRYINVVEKLLADLQSQTPRAEVLAIMLMLRGSRLLRGEIHKWDVEADEVYDAIIGMADAKYGKPKNKPS